MMFQASMLALLLADAVSSFYLPGVSPKEYMPGEVMDLKVSRLSSTKTHLPFEYYSLPFCKPEKIENAALNLGEVLHGTRIENTLYHLEMEKVAFSVLCKKSYTAEEIKQIAEKVENDYRVHMVLDNLPAATKIAVETAQGQVVALYERGFPLGFMGSADRKGTVENRPYLNNHIRFIIKFHKDEAFTGARIVGFEVEAMSVKHKYKGDFTDDVAKLNLLTVPVGPDLSPQPLTEPEEVIFTYDVSWEHSDIRWASRWDLYLYMGDDQIHWVSIINSLAIVLLLTGIVAMIMIRILRRDFNQYNTTDKEELQEESGWKLVHGDVFRPPSNSIFLAAFCGNGVQLLMMTCISLICAALGFLSPANRGALLTSMLVLYVLMGVPAGFTNARLYKYMKGSMWRNSTLLCAFFFPSIVFCIFLTLNFFIWGQGSTGAVPFGTLFGLMCMWFLVSVPTIFLGAFFGFRRPIADTPVRTNDIPRTLPEQKWYMGTTFNVMIGGLLPFGAIFIELFFILSSIWLQRFYYVFGFLMIVFFILLVTCAEVAIVLGYFHLCSEDYHWWWRSFFTTGSSAIYLMCYSAYYFSTQLDVVGFVPTLLYFGYMGIASFAFFLLTGTIGFLACYWFVWKIYSSIKVD